MIYIAIILYNLHQIFEKSALQYNKKHFMKNYGPFSKYLDFQTTPIKKTWSGFLISKFPDHSNQKSNLIFNQLI